MALDIYFEKQVNLKDQMDSFRAKEKELEELSNALDSATNTEKIEELEAEYEKLSEEICAIKTRTKIGQLHNINFIMPFFGYETPYSSFEITEQQLITLSDYCQQVMDNHDLAETLLPPIKKFPYGPHCLNERYFKDLETVKTLADSILDNTDINWETECVSIRCNW